ncbi:nuclease EXOG, mitochondrial isoform X2 [Electrophorus electricus]|uniref:nuclease EXOG, mitochondrial isoform X2 n=1 Tax=Electrophorus electricus TaxID=8005 RepID=UPI0015D08B81|nr:nuclease EXOG, mitochondrial isoform X2 [Electrophorus electricus]
MASRIRLVRFFGGFVCGVTVSTGACIAAVKLYMPEHRPEEHVHEKVSAAQRLIELYGLPLTGAETRSYTNHILSYDQTRRTPKWVAEHLSNEKLLGRADRKHCKFKPDPNIPALFTAHNDDYLGSGWSRGHMAPAADNKFSEKSMAETFYLSNIIPQNYENNAGFWNRLEMYCRELTERFSDVWVISGPLTLPQVYQDGKKMVSYQLIGKDDVAVPTHLYKVILVRKDPSAEPLALGAFIVPNAPISFEHHLKEYQVSLTDLQRMSGLTFFPKIEKAEGLKNLCLVDSCELMDFKRFTLYITSRKVVSAKTLAKLEKMMSDLEEAGITPDNYLAKLYQEKKQELLKKESPQNQVG